MWLAISTHPDISNAVRSVERYCPAKNRSTGNQRLVLSLTSMVLVVLVLRTSEGLQ